MRSMPSVSGSHRRGKAKYVTDCGCVFCSSCHRDRKLMTLEANSNLERQTCIVCDKEFTRFFDTRKRRDVTSLQITVDDPLNYMMKVVQLQKNSDRAYIKFLEK